MSQRFLVLVLNCGSSSIKFSLLEPSSNTNHLNGIIEKIGMAGTQLKYQSAMQKNTQDLTNCNFDDGLAHIATIVQQYLPQELKLNAIAHRVVHGGKLFSQPVLIDATVIKQITACIPLAPLHNPANLAGIQVAEKIFARLPQVAVFDTAFHQSLPEHAFLYALPYHFYTDLDVRRYGFHGISYQYLTSKACEILNLPLHQNALICAHLGNGCSITAIRDGKSIDTSMGLTPLEGLVMGTRCGDLDPGIIAYLCEKLSCDANTLTKTFNHESGLLGLSNSSMDMRVLQQASAAGDVQAQLAIEIFCYRLAKYIAAYTVPLGRLDALVFSGGIGENSSFVREKTLSWLSLLGFSIDRERNAQHGHHHRGQITQDNSRCALVIPTNEELMIAKQAAEIIVGKIL